MRKTLSYLFLYLALLSYVLTSVGFSVHTCACEGRTELRLLSDLSLTLFEDECEKHDHGSCCRDHKDGCCEEEIIILETQADVKISKTSVSMPEYVILDYALMSFRLLYEPEASSQHSETPPTPNFYEEDLLISYRKMRV